MAGIRSHSISAIGGRPAVSAPVPAKPSSSPSDRGSSPCVSRVQGTGYSQLIRCTASLVDECKKWDSLDSVDENCFGFLLRRQVSIQLEKLPGSCKVLDSVQDIVSHDSMAVDGEPVDLDSLSDVTVTRLWECLERNSVAVANGGAGNVSVTDGKTDPGCNQNGGMKRGRGGAFFL